MVADPGMRLVQMGCLKARTLRSLWSCGSSSRKYGADLQCTCSVWINFFIYASISGGEHIYIGGALLTEAGRFEISKVLSAQDNPGLNKVLAKLAVQTLSKVICVSGGIRISSVSSSTQFQRYSRYSDEGSAGG